jgi:3-oxoadipate enol-lactonase
MPEVTVDGVTIGYGDTGGDGPAVVLVHGFPFDSSLWEPQIQGLADRFRFVTPDLMGFGASDAPDDGSRYSMTAFADQVRAVMNDAGLGRAIVGGLSMGGYVCFEMWRRHRNVIGSLILADTRAEADTAEGIEKRSSQQERVRTEGIDAVAADLVGAMVPDAAGPGVLRRIRAAMDNPVPGYVGGLEAMKRRVDSTGDLVTIDVPTLILVGEHDPITPPTMARTMHELIGGSQLVVVPDVGHVANLEAPDAFNAAVARFVAAL